VCGDDREVGEWGNKGMGDNRETRESNGNRKLGQKEWEGREGKGKKMRGMMM